MIYTISKKEYPSVESDETIIISAGDNEGFWKKDNNGYYEISFYGDRRFNFKNRGERDKVFEDLTNKLLMSEQNNNQNNVMGKITKDIKEFINENRTTIYWIAIIFLADHFFLGGSLRHKLKETLETLLNKITKKETPAATPAVVEQKN